MKPIFKRNSISSRRTRFFAIVAGAVACLVGCASHEPPQVPYISLASVEKVYGPLITAGNLPTQVQDGTGERVGFFRAATGTVWGLPLGVSNGGDTLACAPAALHDASVTDTLPAGSTIIGATNEPTGIRGGTGRLELLLRHPSGAIHWRGINGARFASAPSCWAPDAPGPKRQFFYYRLDSRAVDNHESSSVSKAAPKD